MLVLVQATLLLLQTVLCKSGQGDIYISVAEYGKSLQRLHYNAADNDRTRYIELTTNLTYQIKCDINVVSLDISITNNNQPSWSNNNTEIDYMNTEEETIGLVDSNPHVFYNSLDTSANLWLYKLNNSFIGRYRCAVNTENYKDIVISIANPSLTLSTEVFNKIEGTSNPFFVAAILNGNPKPSIHNITWLYNNNPIDWKQLNMDKFELFNFFVVFTVPSGYERKQTGTYTAMVNTTAGNTSASFRLQVLTHLLISFESNCDCLKDRMITVKHGESFSLSCKVDYASPSPLFTWFKDGENTSSNVLVPATHLAIEQVTAAESKLIFTEVTYENAGMYHCKANNTLIMNIQSVKLQVERLPDVIAISPLSIDVPIETPLQLSVRLDGSYHPVPNVTWFHYASKHTNQTQLKANERIVFNGKLGLNLTVQSVNVNDSGIYTLEVANNVDKILIHFNISILVPPVLSKQSNTTVYARTGSQVTFSTVIYDAQPPVTLDNVSWRGNFDPDQQQVTYENATVSLVLSDLEVSNTGTITVIIYHPARVVNQTYELIVLNAPSIPNLVSIVQCSGLVKISWEASNPSPDTAHVDRFILEQRACSFDDLRCAIDWNVLTVASYIDSQSFMISLEPNQYSFRLTSCNSIIGCGESLVIGTEVKTNVQDFIPKITNINTNTLNSSSILIEWNQISASECHQILWYTITCTNTKETMDYYTKNINAKGYGHYETIMTPLGPDSEYNCSIVSSYYSLIGNSTISDEKQVYTIGYTYPVMPEKNGFYIVVSNSYVSRLAEEGTLFLDSFDIAKKMRQSIGLAQIIVLRLGNSSILPQGTPNSLYKTINNSTHYQFSTHSNATMRDGGYLPYVAAEFDFNDFPEYFIIGGNRSGSYTNKRLDHSSYYTIFIRLYPWSRFDKLHTVYISSSFSIPLKSSYSRDAAALKSSKNSDRASNNSSKIFAVCVSAILIVACIVIAVIAIRLAKERCARRCKTNTASHIMTIDYV